MNTGLEKKNTTNEQEHKTNKYKQLTLAVYSSAQVINTSIEQKIVKKIISALNKQT